MKKTTSLLGAAVLAVGLAASSFGQAYGPVILKNADSPTFVFPNTAYSISEDYGPDAQLQSTLTINGLGFTNDNARLVGASGTSGTYPTFSGSAGDAANLSRISGNDLWNSAGLNFTIPVNPGDTYILELVFHDNFYGTNGLRVFSVQAGAPGNANNVLVNNMDLNAVGAGKLANADALLYYVFTGDVSGQLQIVMTASVNNPMVSALMLADLSTQGPVFLTLPASQDAYSGQNVTFNSLAVGPSVSYQWGSASVGSGGPYAPMTDGGNISGSSTSTLSINNANITNRQDYVVTATSAGGNTTTPPATLNVIAALSPVTSPAGLNTAGNFVVNEYYGANNGPLTIGGLTFYNNNARLGPSAQIGTANLPHFGNTADATNLSLISESDCYSTNGFQILLPTVAGRNYTLQLLFHDNAFSTAGSRVFGVNAGLQGQGVQPLAQGLDLVQVGAYETNAVDMVLTLNITNSDGSQLEIDLVNSVNNSMISALTLQDTSGAPVPPYINVQPVGTNTFVGRTISMDAMVEGTPLAYQWQSDGSVGNTGNFVNLNDGGGITGSLTSALTISNISMSQAADYQLVISNSAATNTTSIATVNVYPQTVVTAADPYAYDVLVTNHAVDYWRLNEPGGELAVYDVGPGAKDGAVQANVQLGYPGPQSPAFPGFEANNACIQCYANSAADYIATPPLGFTASNLTMIVWLNPNNGQQTAGAGILLSRQGASGTATAGLTYGITLQAFSDYSLRYFWNGASADSGLQVPQGIWSLCALTVTPSNTVIDIINQNGLVTWTNTVANAPCPFINSFLMGDDTFDNGTGARNYNGLLDEPAIFTNALTTSQLLGLYSVGSGVVALPPAISANPVSRTIVNPGRNVTLTSTATGTPSPTVQWMVRPFGLTGNYSNVVNGNGISGAQTGTLTINNVTLAEQGDYVLVASNNVGTAMSNPGRVLVINKSAPALTGEWFTGGQTLQDVSGYNPAGLHDGFVEPTGNPAVWNSSDVPPGFTGSSIIFGGTTGVAVTNSQVGDLDYRLDYDNNITNAFTVAFWAKGFPNAAWNAFCTKNGEGTQGWQIRRNNTSTNIPTFTVQGTASGFTDAGSGASVGISDNNWHHYCGTYDANVGERHLYVDGVDVLNVTRDFGGMVPPTNYHMVFGAKENPGVGNYFVGEMFDARFYNYAVQPGEVLGMITPPAAGAIGLYASSTNVLQVGISIPFTVIIPSGANASGPVTVTIANNAPSVATVSQTTIVFPQNGPLAQTFSLEAVGPGAYSFTASATSLGNGSMSGTVVEPTMIGHWITGAANLLDASGYNPGNQDGSASAGTSIGGATAQFTSDIPPAFTNQGLQSLNLTGSYAVTINGSSARRAGYYPTFDDDISLGFSVAFWARGVPGSGNPWISKSGNTANEPGWEVALVSTSANVPTATIRETATSANNSDVAVNYCSTDVPDANWHHYTMTYDGVLGFRRLYVDGLLNLTIPDDEGPMPPPLYSYLTIGGYDSANVNNPATAPTIGSYFTGKIFDVRMYNYPLLSAEVSNIMVPNSGSFTASAINSVIDQGSTGQMSFSLPAGANTNGPVTVWVTNMTPSVISIADAPGNPFSVVFAQNAYPNMELTLNGLAEGQGQVSVGTLSGQYTPATATVKVYGQHLVGRWLVGLTNLTEYSAFMPPHTHDGGAVAGGAATGSTNYTSLTFSSTAPPGFPGSSISLNGNYAVWVSNSDAVFGGYQSTFDDVIANHFTVAFWENSQAAASQNAWVGVIGKAGDNGMGWQFHRYNGNTQDDFVLRDSGSHVSDLQSLNGTSSFGQGWVHVAVVFDGINGYRAVYTNGVLESYQPEDYGSYTLARNHHLVFGSEEQPNSSGCVANPQVGDNGYLKGFMYDVRVYNYAMSQPQIAAMQTYTAPTLTAQALPGGQVQLSWSSLYPGYGIQSTTSLDLPESWTTGAEGTLQNGRYVVTDTPSPGSPKFYRLVFLPNAPQ